MLNGKSILEELRSIKLEKLLENTDSLFNLKDRYTKLSRLDILILFIVFDYSVNNKTEVNPDKLQYRPKDLTVDNKILKLVTKESIIDRMYSASNDAIENQLNLELRANGLKTENYINGYFFNLKKRFNAEKLEYDSLVKNLEAATKTLDECSEHSADPYQITSIIVDIFDKKNTYTSLTHLFKFIAPSREIPFIFYADENSESWFKVEKNGYINEKWISSVTIQKILDMRISTFTDCLYREQGPGIYFKYQYIKGDSTNVKNYASGKFYIKNGRIECQMKLKIDSITAVEDQLKEMINKLKIGWDVEIKFASYNISFLTEFAFEKNCFLDLIFTDDMFSRFVYVNDSTGSIDKGEFYAYLKMTGSSGLSTFKSDIDPVGAPHIRFFISENDDQMAQSNGKRLVNLSCIKTVEDIDRVYSVLRKLFAYYLSKFDEIKRAYIKEGVALKLPEKVTEKTTLSRSKDESNKYYGHSRTCQLNRKPAKILPTNPNFAEFYESGYITEFPYKSGVYHSCQHQDLTQFPIITLDQRLKTPSCIVCCGQKPNSEKTIKMYVDSEGKTCSGEAKESSGATTVAQYTIIENPGQTGDLPKDVKELLNLPKEYIRYGGGSGKNSILNCLELECKGGRLVKLKSKPITTSSLKEAFTIDIYRKVLEQQIQANIYVLIDNEVYWGGVFNETILTKYDKFVIVLQRSSPLYDYPIYEILKSDTIFFDVNKNTELYTVLNNTRYIRIL